MPFNTITTCHPGASIRLQNTFSPPRSRRNVRSPYPHSLFSLPLAHCKKAWIKSAVQPRRNSITIREFSRIAPVLKVCGAYAIPCETHTSRCVSDANGPRDRVPLVKARERERERERERRVRYTVAVHIRSLFNSVDSFLSYFLAVYAACYFFFFF